MSEKYIMDCEVLKLTHFSGNKNSNRNKDAPFEVHVLVIDDDASTLEISLGLLASLNYKAEGTKHPLVALERLRKKEGYFDLIVIDPHLPDIDGFQLIHILDQLFSLPLIMISMDKDERVMEKALKSGVVRYIVKPAIASDFKGIWQYTVTSMKGKKKPLSPLTRRRDEEYDNFCVEDSWSSTTEHHEGLSPPSSTNLRKENIIIKRKEFVVRATRNLAWEDNNNGSSSSSSSRVTKKSKVVWTSDLQSRFLQAINVIGLENAVPKKILEVMKTPGLTRENVASHMQKYRIFLKRVARMFAMVMNNVTDKDVFLASLASKYPSLMLKNIQEEFGRILKHSKLRSTSSHPYSFHKNPNYSLSYTPSKFQYNYNFPKSLHHSTLSTKLNPIFQMKPYGALYHQKPISLNDSTNFDTSAGLGLTAFDCWGYNKNSLMNESNYSNLVGGRVSPTCEIFRANKSVADMGGNDDNIMENILEQQEKQYEVSNGKGCYHQTSEVRGNNDASLVTSQCSNFSAIDCGNITVEENNSKFSDQQDNQEAVAGEDIDPRVESNDYFPSFDHISDQMLENMNFSEIDLETINGLEQIPQDREDDFMEFLFNNGA